MIVPAPPGTWVCRSPAHPNSGEWVSASSIRPRYRIREYARRIGKPTTEFRVTDMLNFLYWLGERVLVK